MNCISGVTQESSRWRTEFSSRLEESVVDVFRLDFQFLLAGFANPAVFAIDEGMVVDAFAVVVSADIAFHGNAILPYLRLLFLGSFAEDYQIHATI